MPCDDLERWGGEGGEGVGGVCVCVCVYNYDSFSLLYSRNQHIVKQLPPT